MIHERDAAWGVNGSDERDVPALGVDVVLANGHVPAPWDRMDTEPRAHHDHHVSWLCVLIHDLLAELGRTW